ncbi:MAG: hypothetical protein SGBAC_009298 [Bacillariaceae sp.]
MKFLAALTTFALASNASAFAPPTTTTPTYSKAATALNVGEISWEEVGNEFSDDKWYYQPWSGIREKQFYPQSHAGNRMPTFFPPPTETLAAAEVEAPPAPAAALPEPEPVPATPMPETVAESAPAQA